jgi:hypothetical protein
MTKKEFKELTDYHVYTGTGYNRIKTNVIFFGWKVTETGRGFKQAVASESRNCTKAELFNYLYDWVINQVEPPYYVRYKYAETDDQRFKVPLSLNF